MACQAPSASPEPNAPVALRSADGVAPASPRKPAACADGDAADCEKRCERDDRGACFALSGMVAEKDPAKARELMARTCQLPASDDETKRRARELVGPDMACVIAGESYLSDKDGLPRDEQKASALWEHGCTTRADEGACSALLDGLRSGKGLKKDPKRALAVAEDACESSPALEPCLKLTRMLERGAGVPKDAARARRMRAKACEKKSKEECKALFRNVEP